MGGDLDITVRGERGVVIAAVTGEIDISTVTQLRERLFELADNGGTLIVDLNRVTFIDSAGLAALVGTAGELPRTAVACMPFAPGRRPAGCCG
jgi:anti-sigma B factor antagonist